MICVLFSLFLIQLLAHPTTCQILKSSADLCLALKLQKIAPKNKCSSDFDKTERLLN